MQKTRCPQRALQTSSARMQNATIWSRSAICTSAAENGAGDIWAFMFCSHLWSCNETSKPSVRAFMRSGSGAAVGTKERTNAKNRSSFLYLIARLGVKIGYAQSMVVQTVKNTTISRTQIIIRWFTEQWRWYAERWLFSRFRLQAHLMAKSVGYCCGQFFIDTILSDF